MTQIHLLGLSGSLRHGSFCMALLRSLQSALPSHTALAIHPLNDVPLYNQDDDTETPPHAVDALRAAIHDSHGVILISPEYNHGMSGVLKNALDWASRPYGKSSLLKKPVLTMSTSSAFTGGVRAHQQMNETLAAIPARPVLRAQTVIGTIHEKIADGQLTDPSTLKFILAGVSDLIDEIAPSERRGVAA